MKKTFYIIFSFAFLSLFVYGCQKEVTPTNIPTLAPMPIANTEGIDYVYSIENGAVNILQYKGSINDVIMPEKIEGYPITSLGDSSFESCAILKSITIPKSVKTLGDYVFLSCSSLEKVNFLGNAPDLIGEDVFYGTALNMQIHTVEGTTGWEPDVKGMFKSFIDLKTNDKYMLDDSQIQSGSYIQSTVTYPMLSDEEKTKYDLIKKKINNHELYLIDYNNGESKSGKQKFRYDFNGDGFVEPLEYEIIAPNDNSAEKFRFSISGLTIERLSNNDYSSGYSAFGIMDADIADKYVEFFFTDDFLAAGIAYTYRLTDKEIIGIGSIYGGVRGVSGDGKIYYWGGNLFETNIAKFNPDLVLSYYDINSRTIAKTDQIIGKKVTANYDIIVFKAEENVVDGAPVEFDEIIKMSEGKIVKIMKPGETFEVLTAGEITKIKMNDGKIGWIGGFHMVWD